MRKFVVILLLALFLLGPGVVAAEPLVCDYALQSGKLADWLVCVFVMMALGESEEMSGGYRLHF